MISDAQIASARKEIIRALRAATGNSDSAGIFEKVADFAVAFARDQARDGVPFYQGAENGLTLIGADLLNAAHDLAKDLEQRIGKP